MSDELHFRHETDDPHRLEVPLEVDANGEWKPELWTPPPVWYGSNGRPYTYAFNIEPDVIKTRDGEYKFVGASVVPPPRGFPHHTAANLYAAVTGTPSPELEQKALEESIGNKIREMQTNMAQQFMRDMDSAMLYGNPYHSEDEFIRRWNPSRWYRFKLWVRQTINRVRVFFARDDEEDWGYDE